MNNSKNDKSRDGRADAFGRRDFLTKTALAGAALALSSVQWQLRSPKQHLQAKVARHQNLVGGESSVPLRSQAWDSACRT